MTNPEFSCAFQLWHAIQTGEVLAEELEGHPNIWIMVSVKLQSVGYTFTDETENLAPYWEPTASAAELAREKYINHL